MRKKPRVKTMAEMTEREMRNFINSRKRPDKQFFLDLLQEVLFQDLLLVLNLIHL